MTDYSYESLSIMIKRISELRDEYVTEKEKQDKRWDELNHLKKELREYLKYHGIIIHPTSATFADFQFMTSVSEGKQV